MLGGGTTARLISEGLGKVTIDNQDRSLGVHYGDRLIAEVPPRNI